MKITLRNIVMAAVAVATVAVAANSAIAESKVNVPFNFVVAGKTYPAGEYRLDENNNSNFVTLRNQDSSVGMTWILRPGDPAPTSTKVSMQFDQINKKHALRLIQYGSLTTPRLDKGAGALERTSTEVIEGQ